MKHKWRVALMTLLFLVVVVLAGDWVLTSWLGQAAAADATGWPSKVIGPPCLTIARERHIPQDLANHTCEAIKE
jgi:C4-dicarboxylate-specific signal transduction histidine kinase